MALSNYDQITTRMTKAQVERILGPPTTVETKDMMIFKKTTYRYEDGEKFAMFTFKNDGLGSEEGKSSVRTKKSTSAALPALPPGLFDGETFGIRTVFLQI